MIEDALLKLPPRYEPAFLRFLYLNLILFMCCDAFYRMVATVQARQISLLQPQAIPANFHCQSLLDSEQM
jgi:hypothetical protein